MYSYIIIGAPRTGKSHYTKEKLGKANPKSLLIYDENEEYTHLVPEPITDPDEFLTRAKITRGGILVFEEATTFVTQHPNPIIVKLLAQKFHHKNTMFFIFHSIRDVPFYVWNKSMHAILFKTNDDDKYVHARFRHPALDQAFKEVKESSWIMTGKNYPGTNQEIKYSIHKTVSIYGIPE